MRYLLSPACPEAHLFSVRLEIDAPDPDGQALMLPAWTPGSYMIRDFARHVVRLDAHDDAGPVAVRKTDKQTWWCAPAEGALRVDYQIHAWDASVRAAALDATGGFCNGTSVFLCPVGQAQAPCELEIRAEGAPSGWQVATAMTAIDIDAAGFGRYRASDYEELVDHPIRFGVFRTLHFEVAGVPHAIVLPDHPRVDADRLCTDVAKACHAHVALFAELPTDRYVFFMHVVGSGFGGLEHRASAVLEVARDSLPQPGDGPGREAYQQLLGLCSHEYFHLWNVKRMLPAVFRPYDLSREVHTGQLWAFEGITSYYDDLALCRAGLLSVEGWLERVGRIITRVHRGAGRFRQTLAESSFDAWTRFYKADENAPNAIVSYYAKGALVALALDLTIRLGTRGDRSLDDVMRALWRTYGRTGDGVPEDGVERMAAAVSGLDLGPFFEHALRSTRELELAGLLSAFGIRLDWEIAEAGDGFIPQVAMTFREDGTLPRVQQVLADGPAQSAGLAPGDRIVAVDGYHAPAQRLAERIARLPAGEPVSVHVLRDDRLLSLHLVAVEPPADKARLEWLQEPDEETRARRSAWLGDCA